ncbi:phage portal protein [Priestia aryabhattai]|uniref:phage portal protein n=1 Tax=Priestia aryabhattai TaxID=412384 RepID=UPI002881AE99|nr:phage portal protein [Priestia aryabhattai]MDT0149990.1 phage portal protein [Priestia aryabhattai]MDT0155560.1 phage portal protein [Priestia aryabhattai]
MKYFEVGEFFPPVEHEERIIRYKENKKLFKGNHWDIFRRYNNSLTREQKNMLYTSVNFPSLIAKKSSDFLFGEHATFSAGKKDGSKEQLRLDEWVEQNDMSILNYESALSNSYRGDAFFKIRYGQSEDGQLPKEFDPFRVIIEQQNAEYVFPETALGDANKIVAYHIAVPYQPDPSKELWNLEVESHYAGRIDYASFEMRPLNYNQDGEVTSFKISGTIGEAYSVNTGVQMPLIVHIPNYATDDSWEGIDDITELRPIMDEINNRLSQIASILDKHSDPAIIVPAGSLQEDADGNPTFRVGLDKVFETMGKDDVQPSYITWDGQLQNAFTELEKLVQYLLIIAEIPEVAIGKGDAGTSGNSGLAIKWQMNSLLAKVNRKRQYYNKGLKRVFMIAQLLEKAVGKADYELFTPVIKFKDGLPKDELEMSNIVASRTGGAVTMSQKSALMYLDDLTEEQAEAELERIEEEQEASQAQFASPSIFNEEDPLEEDTADEETPTDTEEKPKEE